MKKECIKCKYYKNYYKSTECYCKKVIVLWIRETGDEINERTREDLGRDKQS